VQPVEIMQNSEFFDANIFLISTASKGARSKRLKTNHFDPISFNLPPTLCILLLASRLRQFYTAPQRRHFY